MASGIYAIVNTVNGKRYVGSAVSLAHRWRQHRCELGKGRHNPHMQNAWAKHGGDAFEFRVIELVEDKLNLLEREQHYIDQLKPEYNCAVIAGSNLGVKFGPEFAKKISAANHRLWASAGYREKMSLAHVGYLPTAEHRANLSAANKGKKLSAAHAALLARANTERNQSDIHRALMSAYWKGKPKTPEQIKKMAATKRGQTLTEDHRRKVGDGLKKAYLEGRRIVNMTEERREKIGRSLASLSDDQVRCIRTQWRTGVKQKDLCITFGVNCSRMSFICSGKTYRWVTDE